MTDLYRKYFDGYHFEDYGLTDIANVSTWQYLGIHKRQRNNRK